MLGSRCGPPLARERRRVARYRHVDVDEIGALDRDATAHDARDERILSGAWGLL